MADTLIGYHSVYSKRDYCLTCGVDLVALNPKSIKKISLEVTQKKNKIPNCFNCHVSLC